MLIFDLFAGTGSATQAFKDAKTRSMIPYALGKELLNALS